MTSPTPVVLAVANVFYQTVDLFDYSTGASLGTVTDLIPQPHELAADNAGRRLFVSHTYRSGAYGSGAEQGHEISIIDVDERAVTDVIDIHPFVAPHGLRYCAATGLLYAGVESSDAGNGILIVDPERRAVVGSVATAAPNTHWLAVTSSGDRAYASHKEAPLISVLDLQSRKIVETVELPGGAEEVDVSPDGRFLYAVTPHQTTPAPEDHLPPRLVKIDTSTFQVVGELELERACAAVHVGSNGAVYVTRLTPVGQPFGSAQGALYVIDAETMTLRGTIPLDHESFTMREAPDGNTVAVSNGASDTVSVVNTTTVELERTLTVARCPGPFGGTHGMAFVH